MNRNFKSLLFKNLSNYYLNFKNEAIFNPTRALVQSRFLARDSKRTIEYTNNLVQSVKRVNSINLEKASPKPVAIEDMINPINIKPNYKKDEDIGTELGGVLDKSWFFSLFLIYTKTHSFSFKKN